MNINILFLVPLIHALEKAQTGQGQTVSTSKYLSVSKFLTEKKLQRELIESVRHDVDDTLGVLNSQLKLKFESLEQQLAKLQKDNDTKESDQRYLSLEQKYNNLKQENDLLKGKYDMLKHEFSTLNNSNMQMKKELDNVKNLGSIQPLKEIQTLKQDVQSISAQTQTLSISEQARRQDFLALYNLTVNSKNALNTIEKKMDNTFVSIEQNQSIALKNIEKRQSDTFTNLERNQSIALKNIEKRQSDTFTNQSMALKSLETLMNKMSVRLQQQIHENGEKVAVTSCVSSDITYSSGQVIKFPSVKTKIGISDISSLTSSGKFTCEKAGLYYVSVIILNNPSQYGWYSIMLNGISVSTPVFVSKIPSFHIAVTKSEAVELKVNDKLWVQVTSNSVEADTYGSCLSIVKIK